jgi:hypothetical protein
MPRKHFVLIGLLLSAILLIIATQVYPGGNWADPQAPGFDWTKNFFSNLFPSKALNGAESNSRYWADAGMVLLACSFAVFFIGYADRLPDLNARRVVKWSAVIATVTMTLVVTPMHDLMVALSSTFFLLCIFYVTVFVLRSRLHLFKVLCVLYMGLSYYTLYLYGMAKIENLAIMQKVTVVSQILLLLGLQYFTKVEDFEPKTGKQ